jgi:phosphate transport system substrate-binding protein
LTAAIVALAALLVPAGPAAAETAPRPANRDTLRVLSSPLQINYLRAVSDQLTRKYNLPPIEIVSMLAAPAVKAFCAGVSDEDPDVIAIPRRMERFEFNHCLENGVLDVVELQTGYDALVLVVRKGDLVFNLTPRAMFFALAQEIPVEDNFIPNDVRKWKEIDTRLPDLEINVLGSANGTSINTFFKDIFMEGGCRGLRQFKRYYSAEDRVKQCTTLREDGRYIPIKAPIAVNFKDKLKAAPPGAVAVIPYTVYKANRDWLDVLPVLNVIPTDRTINDDEYEAVYPVRYYVKRAHMEPRFGGVGVVKGLYTFLQEIMSEDAIGAGGYLEGLGLVIDDPEERAANREAALRLERFKR